MLVRLPAGRRLRIGRKAGLASTAALLVAGAAVISTAAGAAPAEMNNGQAHQVLTDPQPGSNADFSGHGANTHGAYDSTRDGSPSGNGNGNGNSVGKPCAGCVGKADNKQPPGQMPDGSDHNAGYECDRNHGIGRTNPAHTGCGTTTGETTTTGTTGTTGTTTGETTATTGGTTTGETTTGETATTTTGETATTGGTTTGETTTGQQGVAGAAVSGQQPNQVVEAESTERSLAATGTPVLQLVGIALVALAGGVGFVFLGRARRRRADSTA